MNEHEHFSEPEPVDIGLTGIIVETSWVAEEMIGGTPGEWQPIKGYDGCYFSVGTDMSRIRIFISEETLAMDADAVSFPIYDMLDAIKAGDANLKPIPPYVNEHDEIDPIDDVKHQFIVRI